MFWVRPHNEFEKSTPVGVLLVWAAVTVSQDGGGSGKVVGMAKATAHSCHMAFSSQKPQLSFIVTVRENHA